MNNIPLFYNFDLGLTLEWPALQTRAVPPFWANLRP